MVILYYSFNFIFLDSYEQGLRRMKKAYSDVVVHSSNIDDVNSSDEEEDIMQLSNDDLRQYLNVPLLNTIASGRISGKS